MYPRSFLCDEAKIKQRTPLKKELCEIGEEATWESRFTFFFKINFSEIVFGLNKMNKNLTNRVGNLRKELL